MAKYLGEELKIEPEDLIKEIGVDKEELENNEQISEILEKLEEEFVNGIRHVLPNPKLKAKTYAKE